MVLLRSEVSVPVLLDTWFTHTTRPTSLDSTRGTVTLEPGGIRDIPSSRGRDSILIDTKSIDGVNPTLVAFTRYTSERHF